MKEADKQNLVLTMLWLRRSAEGYGALYLASIYNQSAHRLGSEVAAAHIKRAFDGH